MENERCFLVNARTDEPLVALCRKDWILVNVMVCIFIHASGLIFAICDARRVGGTRTYAHAHTGHARAVTGEAALESLTE